MGDNCLAERGWRPLGLARLLIGAPAIWSAFGADATVSDEDMDGYTLAYDRDELQFPVYVVVIIGLILLASALVHESTILFSLALGALGFAYHNAPLLEKSRPRIGAAPYGVLVEGLGIIPWREIKEISLAPLDARGASFNELRLRLGRPLAQALIADWRKRPWYRLMMRLPWSRGPEETIRIPLDVFGEPPDKVLQTFERMYKYYRA